MISSERREIIKSEVLKIFYNSEFAVLPIPIYKIANSLKGCRVITYERLAKVNNVSVTEIINNSGTEDAFLVKTSDGYKIVVNDSNYQLIHNRRIRWSIAHEIGHFVLNHPLEYTEEEERLYDEEADAFVKYLLIPYPALLLYDMPTAENFREICDISVESSQIGFKEFNKWKSNPYYNQQQKEYSLTIQELFSKYTKCKTCGTYVSTLDRGTYCQVCGDEDFVYVINKTEDIVKYSEIPVMENGKSIICPICKNENTNIAGDYCQICGTNIVNRCSHENDDDLPFGNYDCEGRNGLPGDARYCPYCGEPSTFLNNGILTAWDALETKTSNILKLQDVLDLDEDLPF